jgi:small GTP-binding protein
MQYKVVIVGNSNTGKTSLLNQYVYSKFKINVPTTIGVEFSHKDLEDETKLLLWDTAGQERFQSVCSFLYRGAHAVMFVYDMTSRDSFLALENWWRQYRSFGDINNSVAILVGNKADQIRQVSSEEARAWAVQKGICYSETSAMCHEQVHETFSILVRQLHTVPFVQKQQQLEQQQPTSDRCFF